MNRHPTDGTVRRLLDEPAGVSDADRAHVAGCPTCLAELARARTDAAAVTAAMTVPAGEPDVDAGWRRLSAGLATERASRAAAAVPARARWAARLRSPIVAVAGVVQVLTAARGQPAHAWKQVGRGGQVAREG
jgi:hypothetical protein